MHGMSRGGVPPLRLRRVAVLKVLSVQCQGMLSVALFPRCGAMSESIAHVFVFGLSCPLLSGQIVSVPDRSS